MKLQPLQQPSLGATASRSCARPASRGPSRRLIALSLVPSTFAPQGAGDRRRGVRIPHAQSRDAGLFNLAALHGWVLRLGGSEVDGQAAVQAAAALDEALAKHLRVPTVRGVLLRRLEDELLSELGSFPLDRLASGRCPSQALFLRSVKQN